MIEPKVTGPAMTACWMFADPTEASSGLLGVQLRLPLATGSTVVLLIVFCQVLTGELAAGPHESPRRPAFTRAALVEAVTTRVMDRLTELHVVEPQLDNVST